MKLTSVTLLLALSTALMFSVTANARPPAPVPLVIEKLFTVDGGGSQLAGILTLPPDYATNADSMALFCFFHGAGESGDGTIGPVEKIYANGSPVGLAAGGNAMTFTSPLTGKAWRFATFGLQGVSGWCASALQGDYVVSHELLKNYRIARSCVFVGGLSAGGEVTWETITNTPSVTDYAAAIPMSTPTPNVGSINLVPANRVRVWAFHGTLDGGQTAYWNSQNLVALCNAAQPGTARLTSFNGGHCCWQTYFDPGYREPVTYFVNRVAKTASLNVYEFCLLFARGSNAVLDTGAAVAPPSPTDSTKAYAAVSVVGTVVTLDASGSHVGAAGVASWWWDYAGPTGAPKPWWSDGRSDGGATFFPKQLNGLAAGVWTFTLTVVDKGGNQTKAVATGTVGGPVIITPPPTTRAIKSVTVALVNGLLVSTTTWTDGTTSTQQ